MGQDQSITYGEAGMRHGDTVAYKDEDVLATVGKHPDRITAIRVWWSEYCVGIETFYDGTSAGARMGSEFVHGTVYSEFVLADGEYITKITGRHGDVIDQFTIHTNLGRAQQFGTSTGGSAFSIEDTGKVVKGFTVGFGGHLHFIGCHFQTYTPPPPPPEKSAVGGYTHGDTVAFDDYTTVGSNHSAKMTEIRVLHDGNMVFGVEGIYSSNGLSVSPGTHVGNEMTAGTQNQSVALPDGVYVTGISGKHGNVIDSLTITLSTGLSYTFGGTGGDHVFSIVPHGKKVFCIGGGTGGHLHNIHCWYQ